MLQTPVHFIISVTSTVCGFSGKWPSGVQCYYSGVSRGGFYLEFWEPFFDNTTLWTQHLPQRPPLWPPGRQRKRKKAKETRLKQWLFSPMFCMCSRGDCQSCIWAHKWMINVNLNLMKAEIKCIGSSAKCGSFTPPEAVMLTKLLHNNPLQWPHLS